MSPNSSETAWNIQTPFYRMDTDNLMMVYVNFHNPICPRDFSGGGGEGLAGRYCLSLNYSRTAWNFQTPLSLIVVNSIRMDRIDFHRPTCPRDLSVTTESFLYNTDFFFLRDLKHRLHLKMDCGEISRLLSKYIICPFCQTNLM